MPEEVLEKQMETWSPDEYEHFKKPIIEKSTTITRVWWDNSTSNLFCHAKECNAKVAPEGERITDFAHSSIYSKAWLCYLLAIEFLEIVHMLYAKAEVLHPMTVSQDVQEIFGIAQKHLADHLQVCYCNQPIYLPGKIEVFILDFIKLTQGHTGIYLVEQLMGCLKEFGIEKKILGITADNTTNNNIMAAELKLLGSANGVST
ncbi:uncharacterized protein PHACADRAFT_33969 [Phanerochaete carnosa HHB-10118-sp]|uniref:HAT C-terminal dimerisation domain-containing protein n=1 Tax=Phanerochaete carnosa (strain HHB-10118-sp) TaxID=650164 RepID=K5VAZ1_PHACS|nr:uncharacterized protein PHACADRAFT_33969 [Phanerochaete carnosa HHB-10118-sp]EKM48243.1 hypothetical protein PHACADRAFT_33969 [Phanerochaete carnosa HHB-10118-sp]